MAEYEGPGFVLNGGKPLGFVIDQFSSPQSLLDAVSNEAGYEVADPVTSLVLKPEFKWNAQWFGLAIMVDPFDLGLKNRDSTHLEIVAAAKQHGLLELPHNGGLIIAHQDVLSGGYNQVIVPAAFLQVGGKPKAFDLKNEHGIRQIKLHNHLSHEQPRRYNEYSNWIFQAPMPA